MNEEISLEILKLQIDKAMNLLQDESGLQEIVRLVGRDSLSEKIN